MTRVTSFVSPNVPVCRYDGLGSVESSKTNSQFMSSPGLDFDSEWGSGYDLEVYGEWTGCPPSGPVRIVDCQNRSLNSVRTYGRFRFYHINSQERGPRF